MSWTKDEMAKYVATLLEKGSSVNLGIGLPSLVAENIDPSKEIMIHSENGVLGVSGRPSKKDVSPTLINAGKETISINQAASYFDSSLSFGMIRGGHIDYCILGAMEVDCERNLANWMIPGKKVTGMGGAMDLVNGAKKIFIMMTHFNKHGEVKLLKKTSLPLTGKNVVDDVITELGHFRPNGKTFEIIKLASGVREEDCKLP
ncbi:MAG: succinyl-CoA--3-ketoacid-CoA transferase [Halobacteriovoraceae bacterium]|nr:succinyl-CoA--3-ketoacid-CoA transferase [Halobacteriovoraceae bacterium]|tara:strand:- start:50 stop:658 length:609 start_codon:yes stop_codon:yes gene_type:complete